MSELAFNINGEAFDLPATATGWRVRRMRQGRGAPEVVYGKDGIPLVVPIEAGLEELRQIVGNPGRYRLDAIDDRGKTVDDVPASYVVVPTREQDVQAAAQQTHGAEGAAAAVLGEAMRLNTELAKAVVDRFPEMMTAAAELLRAADGAGLPRREARVVDDDDEQLDDEGGAASTSSPTFELINNLVAQVIPLVMTGFVGKKINIGSALDWRKAAANGKQQREQAAALDVSTSSEPAEETTEPGAALPPIDPKTMAHFIAIQSTLAPNEAALAKQIAAELSPTELRAWFDELSALSVPDAVAKVRSMLGAPKAGGAS